MENELKESNWFQYVSYIVIAILIVEVVLLTKQNRELKGLLSGGSTFETLQSGEKVEPIRVQTLDGNVRYLTYTDTSKKYLLFILSTTCPHCERNLTSWQEIVKSNKYDDCNVIGLSIDSVGLTAKYMTSKNVSFYLASAVTDTSFKRKYKLFGVPETILIDGSGRVEKSWIGELNQDQTREIINRISASRALNN